MNNWIKWNGGECPVDRNTVVEVMNSDNDKLKDLAKNIDWKIYDCNNIIKYRILSEEKPTLIDQIAKAQSEINKLKEQAQEANEALIIANEELSQLVKQLEQEITDKTGLSCVIGVDVHESVKVDNHVKTEKTKQLAGVPEGVDIYDPDTWKSGILSNVLMRPMMLA